MPSPLPQRCPTPPSRVQRRAPMKQLLTDRALRNLKPAPAGKRLVIWDSALPSFGIRVTDTGKASFFVMRRRQGDPKPVRVVLGSYPAISLSDARERARQT